MVMYSAGSPSPLANNHPKEFHFTPTEAYQTFYTPSRGKSLRIKGLIFTSDTTVWIDLYWLVTGVGYEWVMTVYVPETGTVAINFTGMNIEGVPNAILIAQSSTTSTVKATLFYDEI
jgi:hypothetical protein